ncbi:MAG: DUF6943 family protein, partial [Bacteroidales bacterium]
LLLFFLFSGGKNYLRAQQQLLVFNPLILQFMSTFSIKSYRSGVVYSMPHFFILNKGNNSGKPLLDPCANCFVIQFQCEEEKEKIYWLMYSLWQSKAFYQLLRGSVIPFVVLRDVKSCLSDSLTKVEANPAQFEKAVAALRSLEAMENQYKQNLILISKAMRMLYYKYL